MKMQADGILAGHRSLLVPQSSLAPVLSCSPLWGEEECMGNRLGGLDRRRSADSSSVAVLICDNLDFDRKFCDLGDLSQY
jgi:hypothetical protein